MADVVDTLVVHGGYKNYTIRITNVSDGTGEAAVSKITLSGLVGPNKGLAPTAVKIKEASWSIQGFTSVRLFWAHTTPDEACVFAAGNGYANWTGVGGLVDPRSAGGTGNLTVTTAGAAANATYDITLVCELKS